MVDYDGLLFLREDAHYFCWECKTGNRFHLRQKQNIPNQRILGIWSELNLELSACQQVCKLGKSAISAVGIKSLSLVDLAYRSRTITKHRYALEKFPQK